MGVYKVASIDSDDKTVRAIFKKKTCYKTIAFEKRWILEEA